MNLMGYAFGKRFSCGHVDGSYACYEYVGTLNRLGNNEDRRTIIFEGHHGACNCSYCQTPHPWVRLKGLGWRVIAFRTFRARWYLRWTTAKLWKGE